MAWTVATKADVLALYSIDIELLQDRWSSWAESLLLEYIGKESVADITTTTNFVEYLSGTDGRVLLTDYPINTLNSIVINEVSHSVTGYDTVGREIIAKDVITVPDKYEGFPKGYRNIVIDYDTTVPDQDIYNLAVVTMIIAMVNYEGRKGADRDIEWGVVGQQYGGDATGNQNIGLISHLNTILYQLIGKKNRVKIR